MKRGVIGTTEETLCWKCANCTQCSWADGIPVKGWTATPTIVRDCDGDFRSYLVEKCPLFKEDTKKQVTIEEIARILGKPMGTVVHALRTRGGTIFVRGWLKEKGYKLGVYKYVKKNGQERREFILDKLPQK